LSWIAGARSPAAHHLDSAQMDTSLTAHKRVRALPSLRKRRYWTIPKNTCPGG